MVSLDRSDALHDVPVIDMVKMDVEGSEPDVVDGMKGLIAAGRIRRVLCEFNSGWLKMNNTSVDQLADQFRKLGFDAESKTPWQTGPPAMADSFMSRTCCTVIAARLAASATSPKRVRCSIA